MKNGLPEIVHTTQQDYRDSFKDKRKQQTPPKVSYRGITLKQYFRLCDQTKPNESLRQIKEESRASSSSSFAQTPTFNHEEDTRNIRAKIKTEVCQVEHQNNLKSNPVKMVEIDCRKKVAHVHSLQKNQKSPYYPMKKKEERKKVYTKVHSQPSKEQMNMLNRSTLNSFYQIQENKKRMLKKLQLEKDRANNMRLSDAFFITKYGSRFLAEPKAIKQN